jgi:KDO2-lipid IV(A) lauroyltransferase
MNEETSKTAAAQELRSRWVVRLVMGFARRAPLWVGYAVANAVGWLAGRLAPRRRSILEANLVPVLGTTEARRLRRTARQVFPHAVRSYYEIVRNAASPNRVGNAPVTFEEPGWGELVESCRHGRGVVLVVTHQSSFDLGSQALARRGFRIVAISLPTPPGSAISLAQLRMAAARAIRVMSTGPQAVREAIRALRRGEIVAMAGDRHVNHQGTVVQFFGRPTLLPDGHVRLALHADAAIYCGCTRYEAGRYFVRAEKVNIVRTGDREADIRRSAQRIAQIMEARIRAHPEQWHLFQRLWD